MKFISIVLLLVFMGLTVSLESQDAVPDGLNFIGAQGSNSQNENTPNIKPEKQGTNIQNEQTKTINSPLVIVNVVLVAVILVVFNLLHFNPIITAVAINCVAIIIGMLGLKLQSFEFAMGPSLIVIIYIVYRTKWKHAKKDGSADKRFANNYRIGPGFGGLGKHSLFSMGLLIIMTLIFLYVFKW
jgi:hypothetical protein